MGFVQMTSNDLLPTGKRISPVGAQIEVGSFPVNMVASLDGKYLFVSDAGYREYLTSIRVFDGKVISSINMAKVETSESSF